MLIYIIHLDKIFTFRLPLVVSGNYMLEDCDSEGNVRSLINVVASSSKWIINSNENVRIISNNKFLKSSELSLYNWYKLSTVDGEKISLFCMPLYENKYVIRSIDHSGKMIVGKKSDCDIVVSNNNFSEQQFELLYDNGKWYIRNLDLNHSLFINGILQNEGYLDSFDIIFVDGFKFVVCGNLIYLNNSVFNISLNTNLLSSPVKTLSVPNFNSLFQTYSDYYSQNDYFSKSPVFFKKITEVSIELKSPEEDEFPEFQSVIMTIIPTALMGITTLITTYYTIINYSRGDGDEETLYTTIVMIIVMFILCFIWPFIEKLVDKIRVKRRNKKKNELYNKYLEQKREYLEKIMNEQKAALFLNNLSLEECQNVIFNRTSNLFSLNQGQEQFLKVRLGTGKVLLNCHFDYNRPDFVVKENSLQKQLDSLVNQYKYIDRAPLTFSLKNSIAFINSKKEYNKYIESLVIQISALHDYHEVKIVLFTDKNSKLYSAKILNHCWNDDRSFRYVATSLQDAETLSSELYKIFSKRSNLSEQSSFYPYFVIICDNINKYRNVKIISDILHTKNNYGFSFVVFASKLTEVPEGCNYFCDYSSNSATLFKSDMEENDIISFLPEFADKSIDYSVSLSKLANIPIKASIENSGITLPEKFGFLEMYNVGNVEQLNSSDRWKNSQIVNTLAAPIGIDTSGNILYLDLHEKKHGPHGLIAGMTGSGKSETIITYLLSLAVNYSPDEVQFVLIDYKGGGLAGAFENRKTGVKLPHLVGTITNLDTSEMNRTLVSIKSELKRRQMIFNRAKENLNTGTIDIYKYQALVRDGQIEEPLSHLFIVCDEFAELKQQQPEFMDEIVSAARIGRSLGIHLILATQKPSGVVDDQVWSNSRFKICCKVQTAEDSSEMLRKPDAAFLKESGRFYLQIGYDEYYVMAQSGYSGVEYVPSDRAVSKLDNTISFINSLGEIYKNANYSITKLKKEPQQSLGEELTNIVKYLIDVAKKGNYKYHQLWLDNIPEILLYNRLIAKYHPSTELFNINPVIGEYDDPKSQKQGLVTLPLTFGGNTYIVGNSGSGKSTLFSTIISSTIINHNSEEVNIYIIDMGAEKLNKFADAPQVGDVLTISDKAEMTFLIFMLQLEIAKRQKYYSKNGSDFLSDVKKKKSPFPNILVFLYDIDTFKENFDYFLEESIVPLARNSSKYGIDFIVSGNTANSLGYSAEQCFNQFIMLNVSDSDDYHTFFSQYPVIKKNAGRGIVDVNGEGYEFQTCLFFEQDNELKYLKNIINQLNSYLKTKAKPVPRIPETVTFDLVKPYISNFDYVPLGISLKTAQIGFYNFNKLVNVISSDRITSFTKFLYGFQKLISNIPNTKMIILNAFDNITINQYENIKIYNNGFSKVLIALRNNILKYNNMNSDEKFVVLVLNYNELNSKLKEKSKENSGEIYSVSDLIHLSRNNNNFKFIIYDLSSNSDDLKNGDLIDYFDGFSGIWIGNNFDSQMLFESKNGMDFSTIGDDALISIEDGYASVIKYVR